MKMNRRFIGVEQMDYIDSITMKRLISVINGDSSGISPEVNWMGGGSFVYCELAKLNQTLIDEIENATDEETIIDIFVSNIRRGGSISGTLESTYNLRRYGV